MSSNIHHALTLRLAELPSEEIPGCVKEVLDDTLSKHELTNSVRYLKDLGMLEITENGYIPSDIAKKMGSQSALERYSKQSISDLAAELEEYEKSYKQHKYE